MFFLFLGESFFELDRHGHYKDHCFMERKTQKCLLVAWIEQKKGLEQHGVVRWVLAGDFEG